MEMMTVDIPNQRHSATSREAARRVDFKGNQRKVLLLLDELAEYGATDEQGSDALGMDGNSYRPARVTLEKLGLVMKTNATRKTRSNRNAAIYRVTMSGQLEASRYE